MTPQEIQAALAGKFGEAVGPMAETKRDPFFTVRKDAIVEVCRFAKEDPALAMDCLEDLTALDWPARNVIEVVLHLWSFRHRHGACVKVELPREAPVVRSLTGVWRAADWFEREVLDLFGVTFEGHPDPRRIMLPDDWEGHPLRKDYVEAGGWHGISNERENPLVELRRLDEVKRAELRSAGGSPLVSGPAGAGPTLGTNGPTTPPAVPPPTEGKA
ncbi:MAG: NADH-quinone oxidoreductase subunit C [Anaeromyxobacter sp.]